MKKIGVILLNMGGPDSLEAVRPFLFNLFSDRKIIRLGPSFLQRRIAWFIAKRRAPKSAACYAKIGGKSPLLDITNRQAKALEAQLNDTAPDGEEYLCVPGMRYFAPRTKDQLHGLIDKGVSKFVALSMYPHYSLATSGTSIDDFKEAARQLGISDYVTIDSYPDHPLYLKALAQCVEEGRKRLDDKEDFQLVYSAHSLPQKMVDEGDPYVDHIHRTINGLEKLTGIKGSLCFQSRSGPVKWLEPATDHHLMELAERGVKQILCLPISFVSDHIETLYEIDMLYGDMLKKRGVKLVRTPSLNDSKTFISALKDLVMGALKGNKAS